MNQDSSRWPVPPPVGISVLAGAALVAVLVVGFATAEAHTSRAADADRTAAVAEADPPTFYGDVAPVLAENCVACHQKGGFNMGGMTTPMELTNYETASQWAPMIEHVVREGLMPPFDAAERHKGEFLDERYLEDWEKETLIEWASAGAPEGDPDDLDPAVARALEEADEPKEGSAWAMGEPDLVVEMPEPLVLPDTTGGLYINTQVEVGADQMPEARLVKSGEWRVGPHVHHGQSDYVGVIVPGRGPFYWPEGYGLVLPPEPVIPYRMHYQKDEGEGTAVGDRSAIGLNFYDDGEEVDRIVKTYLLAYKSERGEYVPANSKYERSFEMVFLEDAWLVAAHAHMHQRGEKMLLEAKYPTGDGEWEPLLDVPNYRFNWQFLYQWKEPKFIPAGTTLRSTAWWDNTADNPNNPDPDVDVEFGLQTYNEMANQRLFFAWDEEANIVAGEPLPDDVEIGNWRYPSCNVLPCPDRGPDPRVAVEGEDD